MICIMELARKHGMIIQSSIQGIFIKEIRPEKGDLNLMVIGMREISLMGSSMGKGRIILGIVGSGMKVNSSKIILLALAK